MLRNTLKSPQDIFGLKKKENLPKEKSESTNKCEFKKKLKNFVAQLMKSYVSNGNENFLVNEQVSG